MEFVCARLFPRPNLQQASFAGQHPAQSFLIMTTAKIPLVFALLATAVLAAAEPPPVARDVDYAGTKNPQQTLDLYAPAGGKNHPVVVWIHGGGWGSGDKTDTIGPKSQACLDKGFVFVSINYRLLFLPKEHPDVSRPAVGIAEIESDVAKAIRWVHENAGQYGGDPNFIFVMGHSAGAQLAALLCTDEGYLQKEGLPLTLIKGCVPIDGDTYYPALRVDTSTPRRAAGYRRKFPDTQTQRELSAVMHVAPDRGIPPFLLLHVADFPETGTKVQAEILAETLHSAGIPVRVFAAAGKTHLTIDADLGQPGEPLTKTMFEFLDEQVWRANYASWSRSVKLEPASGRPSETK
jgi:acetyl esterase/lipase